MFNENFKLFYRWTWSASINYSKKITQNREGEAWSKVVDNK